MITYPRYPRAKKLRAARLAAGLTQEQLAKLTYYSRHYVCTLESGRVRLTEDFLKLAAEALNVAVDDLRE